MTSRGGSPLDNHDTSPYSIVQNRVSFTDSPEFDVTRNPSSELTVGHTTEGPLSSTAESGSPANAGHLEEQLSRLHDRNVEALVGRIGRKETCVINAAIMASSYGGPKRFNKPIVVDIDLPVWRDSNMVDTSIMQKQSD